MYVRAEKRWESGKERRDGCKMVDFCNIGTVLAIIVITFFILSSHLQLSS